MRSINVFLRIALIVLPLTTNVLMTTGYSFAKEVLEVKLRIDSLRCNRITEDRDAPTSGKNEIDEVYFIVMGPGYRFVRFPDDNNYYQSMASWNLEKRGWIDKNKKERGPPVVWHGLCPKDETVQIQISIWEQDLSEEISQDVMSKSAAKLALGRFENNLQRIENILKDKGEDHLGGFEVKVKNANGKLEVSVKEHEYTKVKSVSGGLRTDFECKGPTESLYRGTMSIEVLERRFSHVQNMNILAADAPWNENKSVELEAGTPYLIVPSPYSRYNLGRITPPWNGHLDWYAGEGEIDGRPKIPHGKLRIGGLAVLCRHNPSKEDKVEVFPFQPFQGLMEISCEHGGVLFFCIVDRPGQYFDNSGNCEIQVYRVN